MKLYHINPNCRDTDICRLHGESGPVQHRWNFMQAIVDVLWAEDEPEPISFREESGSVSGES